MTWRCSPIFLASRCWCLLRQMSIWPIWHGRRCRLEPMELPMILAAEREPSLLPVTGGRVQVGHPQSTVSTAPASGSESAAHRVAGVTAQPTSGSDPLAWRINQTGSRVAIAGLGNAYPLAEQVAAALTAEHSMKATVIDPRQCTSLDADALESLRDGHELVVTLEDGQLEGGWGEKVTAYYANHHASCAELRRSQGIYRPRAAGRTERTLWTDGGAGDRGDHSLFLMASRAGILTALLAGPKPNSRPISVENSTANRNSHHGITE